MNSIIQHLYVITTIIILLITAVIFGLKIINDSKANSTEKYLKLVNLQNPKEEEEEMENDDLVNFTIHFSNGTTKSFKNLEITNHDDFLEVTDEEGNAVAWIPYQQVLYVEFE